MGDESKEEALWLLRTAVLDREFLPLKQFPGLQECQMCWAVVDESSRQLHMDWHDKVHTGLVELQRLLTKDD